MANYPDLKPSVVGEWRQADGHSVINPADVSVLRTMPHFVVSRAETPFGGVKDSGFGRQGGSEGLQCYTVVKNVSHLTA
jgi:Aldehyde dehydrogenase family